MPAWLFIQRIVMYKEAAVQRWYHNLPSPLSFSYLAIFRRLGFSLTKKFKFVKKIFPL